MKNNLRLMIIFAAFGVILGCANLTSAQVKVGGYKKVAVSDAGVVAAANFAVADQGERDEATIELASVETAQRQMVAGTNYKLCLQVNIADGNSDDPRTLFISAVIFQSLKKEYSLKSWEEVDDCD
jgi:hypothetical protein